MTARKHSGKGETKQRVKLKPGEAGNQSSSYVNNSSFMTCTYQLVSSHAFLHLFVAIFLEEKLNVDHRSKYASMTDFRSKSKSQHYFWISLDFWNLIRVNSHPITLILLTVDSPSGLSFCSHYAGENMKTKFYFYG